jgi:DeoR/GlpR family transcriptional regulator of sugar metabolism
VVQRQALQAAEKQAIGLAAADLVQDKDVIGIESGSTTLEVARALAVRPWQNLQVVTNSFTVANELMHISGVELMFVGGSVHTDELGTFGCLAEDVLERLSIDKLFITCRGLHPRLGISNDRAAEGTFGAERAFVASSRQLIVLADHTKLGQSFLIQVVPIGDINVVVTDSLASEELLEELRHEGVQVIVAYPREGGAGQEWNRRVT